MTKTTTKITDSDPWKQNNSLSEGIGVLAGALGAGGDS